MKKDEKRVRPLRESRREFTKAAAAALVAAQAGLAQTPPAARESKAPPNPQPTPTPQQPAPAPSPTAEAYAAVARARFGEQLTPEEFERVKRDLRGNVRAADGLRASRLKNSDEPDFVFSA